MNLNTNRELLIRRKFLNSRSKFGLLNDVHTIAVCQVSAKYPVCKKRLMILVKTGRRESKHADDKEAGIGSKMQDLFFPDVIIWRTVSVVWHWKWENTMSPDSDSRLGSGVDSKDSVQL